MSHQLLPQVSRQLLQAVRFWHQMADFPSFCFVSVLFHKGPERNDVFKEEVCDASRMAKLMSLRFAKENISKALDGIEGDIVKQLK